MVDVVTISSSSIGKPSVLGGNPIEIKVAHVVVPSNAKFLCSCNPKIICIVDEHTGLLTAVNPERAALKGIICSQPTFSAAAGDGAGSKVAYYNLVLDNYNTKKSTGEKSNQLEKKCGSGSPCSSDGWNQPGTPSVPQDKLRQPHKGCPECAPILEKLSIEYDDVYINPYLKDTDKLAMGKTIDDMSLARIINAKHKYMTTHPTYIDCVSKSDTPGGGQNFTPKLTDFPNTPDSGKRKIIDKYCPEAHPLVASIFEIEFNKVGLTYHGVLGAQSLIAGKSESEKKRIIELYDLTYTKVIQSESYRRIRYSKQFLDIESMCHTTVDVINDDCKKYAVYDSNTNRWIPISDEFNKCITHNALKTRVDNPSQVENCAQYLTSDGFKLAGYNECISSRHNKTFKGDGTINWNGALLYPECAYLLIGALKFQKKLFPECIMLENMPLYTSTLAKPFSEKFSGEFEELLKFLKLSDDEFQYVATFTYNEYMSLSEIERQRLQTDVEWIQWQRSPKSMTYVDSNGILRSGLLYDICADDVSKTPRLPEYCPECAAYISFEGETLAGYDECVSKFCVEPQLELPTLDRNCDGNSLNCEPCKSIAQTHGMRSDEWLDCYLNSCFTISCPDCEDTKNIFGADSEEYRKCVQANCMKDALCTDCEDLYKADPLSREYLKCMIDQCFLKDFSLCIQCCDLVDPKEKAECERQYCLKNHIKIDPCVEFDMRKTFLMTHPHDFKNKDAARRPEICNTVLSPDYIDVLRKYDIDILIAGKRVLINEIPYIEDRLKYDGMVVIRRVRVANREDVIAYLGDSVSQLSQSDLEIQIAELEKQLFQIKFSALKPDSSEEILLDSGIISACGYLQRCESQFFLISSELDSAGSLKTTVLNKITGNQSIITSPTSPSFPVTMAHKDIDQHVSNDAIQNLIKNDKSLIKELVRLKVMENESDISQLAINFVKFKIVGPSAPLTKVMTYITENKVIATNLAIEHILGTNSVVPYIKPDDRQLKPRQVIQNELKVEMVKKVDIPKPIVPISIKPEKQNQNYVKVTSKNGVNIVIPTVLIDGAVKHDTTDLVASHLAILNKLHQLKSSEYLKSLLVRLAVPAIKIKETPITSDTYLRLDPIIAETFISDESVKNFLKQTDLNFVTEVMIKSESVQKYQDTQTTLSIFVEIDDEKISKLLKSAENSVHEVKIQIEKFVVELRNLSDRPLYEIPIDTFVYVENFDNEDHINMEFRDR